MEKKIPFTKGEKELLNGVLFDIGFNPRDPIFVHVSNSITREMKRVVG